jgi:hypothetical protein
MSRGRRGKGTTKNSRGKDLSALFRIVVAAAPGTEVSIEPELDLIKAALLYGGEVTLLSATTTMFLGVEAMSKFSLNEQVDLVRKLAPYLTDDGDGNEIAENMDKMSALLAGGGSRRSRLLEAQIKLRLSPTLNEVSSDLRGLLQTGKVDQLAQARAKGLLKIESADSGTAAELIANCVIKAKRLERGDPPAPQHTDRMVATFLAKLSDHLSAGREYLIFDEQIANLTRAAIGAGLFKPAQGPAGRSAQAMTAAGFMGRLPTFPDATVDEVLDIRSDLAPSLKQFRSAMVTLSKDFTSASWEAGFEDEVHDAWVESVGPAVEAIDESVRSDKSLVEKATGVTGGVQSTLPGLAIVGAGVAGHSTPLAMTGATASVTGSLLQALREHKNSARNIRMQPFYFLYALDHALG